MIQLSNSIVQYASIIPSEENEELRIEPTLSGKNHGIMVSTRDFNRIAWAAYDPKFEAVDLHMAVLEKSMIVEEESFMTPPNKKGSSNFFYRRPDGQSFDEFVAGVTELIVKYIRNEKEDNRLDPE